MQINRLFEIIYILLDKKKITAKELAEHFEVSVRTIYRDIDILSSSGIPIYSSQGKGGGINILDEYVLNKSLLSEKEQKDILIALQSLNALDYPEVDRVLFRLSSLFKKNDYNWIEVDFSRWGSDENEKEKFNIIRNAIVNNKIITFQYSNSKGEKNNRSVEPIKLIYKSTSWYIAGFCLDKNEMRIFKISRMHNLEITDETFIRRELGDVTIKYEKNASTNLIEIKLKFDTYMGYRVFDDFEEKEIKSNGDGTYEVTTYLSEGRWIYDYIFSFGDGVEVVEPQELRRNFKDRLLKMLDKYK